MWVEIELYNDLHRLGRFSESESLQRKNSRLVQAVAKKVDYFDLVSATVCPNDGSKMYHSLDACLRSFFCVLRVRVIADM